MTIATIQFLSPEERATLLAFKGSIRDQTILALALELGLRLSELTALKSEDLQFRKKLLQIQSKYARTLVVSADTFAKLNAWLLVRPTEPTGALFTTEKGIPAPLSERAIEQILRSIGQQSQIASGLNARIIRNTLAIQLFKEGVSIDIVQKRLGMSAKAGLYRYRQLANETQSSSKSDSTMNSSKNNETNPSENADSEKPSSPRHATSEKSQNHDEASPGDTVESDNGAATVTHWRGWLILGVVAWTIITLLRVFVARYRD